MEHQFNDKEKQLANQHIYWMNRAAKAEKEASFAWLMVFWACVVVLVLITVMLISGCTPSTSPEARLATDWDAYPAAGMNDEWDPFYTCPWGFDDWTICDRDGDNDCWWHMTSATFAFVCQPRIMDEPIDVPGIKFRMIPACTYSYDYYQLPNTWDGTGKFEAVTNGGGKAITSVTLNNIEPFSGVGSILNFKFEMHKREDLGWKRGCAVFAQRKNKYSSEYGGLANWCSQSMTGHFVGTHGQYIPASTCFNSGVETTNSDGFETITEQGSGLLFDPNAPPPQPDPKPDVTELPLSPQEQFWIDIDPNIVPEAGFALYDDIWYQAKRSDLTWYTKKLKWLYPLSWEDSIERYNIVDKSHPYFCTLLVELSERCDISNIIIPARCNGYDVNLYPVAMAPHGRNVVVRSDYIVTCDIDSPGATEEDLYGNKHVCIPINEGDKLSITISDEVKLLFFSHEWLRSSPLFDINKSGNVDYEDFLEMIK